MNSTTLIRMENVGVQLAGRTVLRDVSCTLPSRHLVALVGPNGAGKTTLLRAIAGLVPADGVIEIASAPLTHLSLNERSRTIGYLPQGHHVHWPLPVRDVVALGRYPHGVTDPERMSSKDLDAVQRAMEVTDVVQFAARPVSELSGGERSRVALARVLAVETPIALADEPTASLDPRYQLDVMQTLRKIANEGKLVVVVTHDLGLAARFADTVLVMADGRLAASGPAERALSTQTLADIFRVSAYQAEHRSEQVILPWSVI